jgi:signal transduction histidine kinase
LQNPAGKFYFSEQMKRVSLLSALLFVFTSLPAHDDTTGAFIQTSGVENLKFIQGAMHVYIDTAGKLPLQNLDEKLFLHRGELPKKGIAKKHMADSKIYLLFTIINNQDSVRSFFFTPGTYAVNITLYSKDAADGKWKELPKQQVDYNGEKAYRQFSIQPGRELQLLVKTNFARTNVILLNPYLINKSFFDYHVNFIHTHWFGLNIFTYILSGILLMMIFFSLANYIQNFKLQFLYYSVYALCMGLMLFLKAANYKLSTQFNFFNEEYLDYFLQIAGYVFYIGFTRMFLDTPIKYPLLNKIFIFAEIILAVFLALFSIFYFTNRPYNWLNSIENASKFFMIFLGIMYIVLGLVKRNRLMNYLLAGNVANLLMGGFSQYIILNRSTSLVPERGLFAHSLFYFEIGILLELILFLLGLVYKNKLELIEKVKMEEAINQEKKKREYETELAVLRAQQEERNRISADMHDELGSGVTAIRLMSEIAIQKTKDKPVEEISKISYNANELMTKMNAIIWSMNAGNDTLGSTIAYIRSYASEYLDNFKIDYKINVPQTIPAVEMTGNKRRNVFLVVKESLNNIMKHARASKVEVNITVNHSLAISISDNGIGINSEKRNNFGNGLKNMQRRMENIGGSFAIHSNGGTTVQIEAPL